MIKKHRLAKPLSILVIMAFLVSTGAVSCGPTSGPLPGTAPGGGPEIQFGAEQQVVPPGGCTMLHWQVSSGEQYPVILNGRQVPPGGQEEVCPQEPTTFELVVEVPGRPVVQTLSIQVEGQSGEPRPGEEQPPEGPRPEEPPGGPAPGGELQLVFAADPDAVPQGGCAILYWEVAPPGEYRVLLNGQQVQPVGEQQVCPPGTTTYELLVETPGGPQVRTLTVNVGGEPGGGPGPTPQGPGPQPTQPGPEPAPTTSTGGGCAGAPTFTYFTASPTSISAGQQVQLSWGAVTNGTSGPLIGSVVLTPGSFGEVGSPGSRQVSPTTTTTYRLTATGCGGTATKDVTVNVGSAAPSATPTTAIPIITGVVVLPSPTPGSTTVGVRLTNNCGRFIDSVYIRKAGESSWGNDRLGQNEYLGHGASRTFPLAVGDYEMRAECCGQKVVSEHSVRLSSGTYDWTVIAALDIHNDTGRAIVEVYIVPSTQTGWGDNWLPPEPAWPGCSDMGYDWLPQGWAWRCYFSPGSYDLKAVTDGGQVYTAQQSNLQGNSAWFVKTQFWTPPADY